VSWVLTSPVYHSRHPNELQQRVFFKFPGICLWTPEVASYWRYTASNPTETCDRITQEVAEYVATNVPGAGYMRRFPINLQEPKLPMPQGVIDRVSAIGHLRGMPQTLTFADAYGREMFDNEHGIDDDHDDDYDYVPADNVSLEYDSDDDLPVRSDDAIKENGPADHDDESKGDVDDGSADHNDESNAKNESQGGNDVGEDVKKLVSDMDSISSNDHSAIIGDSDKSDADGEDFVGTLRSMTAIEE
jgi:hypothetical protein